MIDRKALIGIIAASASVILIGIILLLGWAVGGWFKKSTPPNSSQQGYSKNTDRLQIGVCMAPGVYHGEKIPLDDIIDGIDIWWDWNPGFTTNSLGIILVGVISNFTVLFGKKLESVAKDCLGESGDPGSTLFFANSPPSVKTSPVLIDTALDPGATIIASSISSPFSPLLSASTLYTRLTSSPFSIFIFVSSDIFFISSINF